MVNFKPSEEQELIRETMAGFAREVLRPHAREADERNAVPEAVASPMASRHDASSLAVAPK